MKRGISPVIATTTLIAISVVTVVTTWYWVAAYTTAPASAQSSFKAYTITGVYKNASKTGCSAIDIKNNGGTTLTNTLFYVRDYRTGKPVGINGTDPITPVAVNISSVSPGTTASFNISTPGVISFVRTAIATTGGSTAYDVAIGDPNNDGQNEVVADGEYFINMYKYTAGSWVKLNVTNRTDFAVSYAIAVGDANNDSKQDVVAWDDYMLTIYENKSGMLINTSISDPYYPVESTVIGDANNDGKNEIVVGIEPGTSYHPNQTRMYENKTGKWVETNISDVYGDDILYAVEGLAIGDANNDGKNETVIGFQYWGSGDMNNTRMYQNTSGRWVETNISSWTSDLWAIAIGDANNDGQNEVVVGGEPYPHNRSLRMYKNTSGKWVETNITIIATQAVLTVAIGDANNDGLNEIIAGLTTGSYEVRMYENKSGGWVETNVSDEDGSVWGLAVGDANNDGRNEIALALYSSSPYEIRMVASGMGTTYLPLGTYILRTSAPGFADQIFTCA